MLLHNRSSLIMNYEIVYTMRTSVIKQLLGVVFEEVTIFNLRKKMVFQIVIIMNDALLTDTCIWEQCES